MSLCFVDRRWGRLAYDRRGSGPAVVLVQGLGMPGSAWLNLPGGLLRRGHTVITPDSRGTGRSTSRLPACSMAQLADDLAAVIRHADAGPAMVVGISLGGMVAQHLALRHPSLVRGMVLAATSCGLPFGRPPPPGSLWLLLKGTLSHSAFTRAMLQRRLVHPGSLRRRPDLLAPWARELARSPTPPITVLGQMLAASLHSTGLLLGRIRCPVEVVTGDGDQLVPAINSEILARALADAVLTVVPDTGHVFPIEAPRALPDAIERLERRVAARERAGSAPPPCSSGWRWT